MTWLEFLNLSGIGNCVTESLNLVFFFLLIMPCLLVLLVVRKVTCVYDSYADAEIKTWLIHSLTYSVTGSPIELSWPAKTSLNFFYTNLFSTEIMQIIENPRGIILIVKIACLQNCCLTCLLAPSTQNVLCTIMLPPSSPPCCSYCCSAQLRPLGAILLRGGAIDRK